MQETAPYFGVYVPGKSGNAAAATAAAAATSAAKNDGAYAAAAAAGKSESPYVFRKKIDALRVLKLHKDARLREFDYEDDAVKYTETGYEKQVKNKFKDSKNSVASEQAPFRGPTRQELTEFRKAIEADKYALVETLIWENPRYLVSSGDTPTVLKEGYRYNAMHICALSKRPKIAELILQTVSDPKFVDLFTGKKNDYKMCKELAVNLLDYYLNMPEKGRNETPLHLAAKVGSADVVEVLTSYRECKITTNATNQLPKDVICSRCTNATPELNKRIEGLLEQRFYVPVIRSVDNVLPPKIGQPFPVDSPPNLNNDPLSPQMKIEALAGPMNKEKAEQFHRRWKTPPRIGSNTASPVANSPFITPIKSTKTPPNTPRGTPGVFALQRRNLFLNSFINTSDQSSKESSNASFSVSNEQQNGNHSEASLSQHMMENDSLDSETNNNTNTELPKIKVTLCPATPLMKSKKNAFLSYREQSTDSPITLTQCQQNQDETAAEERNIFDSPAFKERHIKISDTEKGLEVIGRRLAQEQAIDWREYWDFLEGYFDLATPTGLQTLEQYLTKRVLEVLAERKAQQQLDRNAVTLDEVCNALQQFGIGKENNEVTAGANNSFAKQNGEQVPPLNQTTQPQHVPQNSTPYTCVEKSLQVFAKRMTKTMLLNINNITSINDAFLSELKRLKSLICSFKDDPRFQHVNFAKVHCRFATLIVNYMRNSQHVDGMAMLEIQNCLQHILDSPGERKEHMQCVCAKISVLMHEKKPETLPEDLKTEDMCSKAWLEQVDCECQWEQNLSRKTSRRNRLERAKSDLAMKELNGLKMETEDDSFTKDKETWRAAMSSSDSDDENDWFECQSLSDDDEIEIWYTPPQTPPEEEETEAIEAVEKYDVFIYGNEPTKRDLDVFHAIFNVDISQANYPNIYKWKNALMRYTIDDMECFPSPAVFKKTIKDSPLVNSTTKTALSSINKRLFGTPSKPMQRPTTPLNKMRGLFSNYRDQSQPSPLLGSPASPSTVRRSQITGKDNLSLMNISECE